MKANYNVTGKERKALVAAIAELTGDKAIYKFMPTCAFEIGDITVDKEGGVTCEDADKLERLIHNLIADGFTPAEEIESTDEEATAEEPEADEGTGLTVSLPLEKAAVGNLTNLLTAKESLIKKALGIDDLGTEPAEIVDYGNPIYPVVRLIEHRYESQSFTFITTNLTPSEIRKKYGDRIADRFNEMLHVIVFQDVTYRR